MPKKTPDTTTEAEPDTGEADAVVLLPFFYPSINNGTTLFARTQEEADEKAKKLLLDIASQAGS